MLEQIAKTIVPITNLFLAIGLFYFACSNFISGLAKLKCKVISEPKQLLVDRNEDDIPDPYWQHKYRLLPLLVITNPTSKPITIYDFVLNDEHHFNLHSQTSEEYKVTLSSNKATKNGYTTFSNQNVRSVVYSLSKDKYIQPVFTLGPYESISGTLMFHYDTSLPTLNKLQVKTSRKDFEFEIKVAQELTSVVNSGYVPPQEFE